MESNRLHIVPRYKNKWAVLRSGASRALRLFKNKQSAVKYAFGVNNWTCIIVHREDGRIVKEYHNDNPHMVFHLYPRHRTHHKHAWAIKRGDGKRALRVFGKYGQAISFADRHFTKWSKFIIHNPDMSVKKVYNHNRWRANGSEVDWLLNNTAGH